MISWHLYPALSATMPYQMALDEVFFRGMIDARARGENPFPILRFYYASEPSISVGYSHPVELDSASESLPLIRRITGGGRVEHGRDLMFSVIAAKDADESFSSVRMSYQKIHEALHEAFKALGKEASFYRCDEALPRGGDCFKFPIATDLSLDGKKVAGGAQKRSSGVMLHQESVQLVKGLDADAIIREFRLALKNKFEIEILEVDMSTDLVIEAGLLAQEKYASGKHVSDVSGVRSV